MTACLLNLFFLFRPVDVRFPFRAANSPTIVPLSQSAAIDAHRRQSVRRWAVCKAGGRAGAERQFIRHPRRCRLEPIRLMISKKINVSLLMVN